MHVLRFLVVYIACSGIVCSWAGPDNPISTHASSIGGPDDVFGLMSDNVHYSTAGLEDLDKWPNLQLAKAYMREYCSGEWVDVGLLDFVLGPDVSLRAEVTKFNRGTAAVPNLETREFVRGRGEKPKKFVTWMRWQDLGDASERDRFYFTQDQYQIYCTIINALLKHESENGPPGPKPGSL